MNNTITPRPSWSEHFMSIAELTAKRSSCLRRNVGAILVKDNRIIASGYNGAAKGMETCRDKGFCMREREGIPSGTRHEYCHAVHAEQNALLQCAIVGVSAVGSTMYVTHFPCSICTKMIIQSGIESIIYKEGYPDDFSKQLLAFSGVDYEEFFIY